MEKFGRNKYGDFCHAQPLQGFVSCGISIVAYISCLHGHTASQKRDQHSVREIFSVYFIGLLDTFILWYQSGESQLNFDHCLAQPTNQLSMWPLRPLRFINPPIASRRRIQHPFQRWQKRTEGLMPFWMSLLFIGDFLQIHGFVSVCHGTSRGSYLQEAATHLTTNPVQCLRSKFLHKDFSKPFA